MGSTHIRFDWAMKRLLRQKANFGILEGFFSELLHRDVLIQEILESEGNKSDEDDKFNRVDILAKIDNGELVIIEVQNDREHDYFHRMNYGQGKLVTEYIGTGNKYSAVKRIISVNIVYFELGQGDDYIYEGHTEFRGIHANDILQLSALQRKAFPEITSVHEIFARYFIIKVNHFNRDAIDPLDQWIYFLKNNEIMDSFTAKGLQEANLKMRNDNLKGMERVAYDQFIKEQRIRMGEFDSALLEVKVKLQQQIEDAEAIAAQAQADAAQAQVAAAQAQVAAAQAEAIAKEERIEKEKALVGLRAMAQLLRVNGVSMDDIAAGTGLDMDELDALFRKK